jgi:hypothetical protein
MWRASQCNVVLAVDGVVVVVAVVAVVAGVAMGVIDGGGCCGVRGGGDHAFLMMMYFNAISGA